MPLLYWRRGWVVKPFCVDRASLSLESIQMIKNAFKLWKFSDDTSWGQREEVELEGKKLEWPSLERVAEWKLSD